MKFEKFLCDLIKYKTVYPNRDEIEKCFKFIKSYLSDSKLIIKDFEFNKDKSLLICNKEIKDFDVMFVGHIDVVPADSDQFEPRKQKNLIYGRGSFDMKGHDAVMIELLKNIKSEKNIALLLTSDEERGGFNGTNKILNELGYSAKISIVPDAGNNFEIVNEEKGVLQLRVSYTGKEAHSSQPWKGENAIEKLINLYNFLITEYPIPISKEDFKTSINIGSIHGGDAINKVAKECYMELDIRHVANDKKEDFVNKIKKFDQNFNIEILAEGECFLAIDNDYFRLFKDSYLNILNKEPEYSKCESASDGRFFYQNNIACVLMNASGGNIHSKEEFVDCESLKRLYEIYEDFIKKLNSN